MFTKLCFYSTKDGVTKTQHFLSSESTYGDGARFTLTSTGILADSTETDSSGEEVVAYHSKFGANNITSTTYVDQNGTNATESLKSILGYTPVPLTTSVSAWNTETQLGSKTAAVAITLPAVGTESISKMLSVTWSASTGCTSATVTAPTGYTLVCDSQSGGSSVTFTLTVGKFYYLECHVINSTRIGIKLTAYNGNDD